VLVRAHRAADGPQRPGHEARVILEVARSFADAPAATNPRVDRLRFIEAATTDPSCRRPPPAGATTRAS